MGRCNGWLKMRSEPVWLAWRVQKIGRYKAKDLTRSTKKCGFCLRVPRELMKVYLIREVILSRVVSRTKMAWQ